MTADSAKTERHRLECPPGHSSTHDRSARRVRFCAQLMWIVTMVLGGCAAPTPERVTVVDDSAVVPEAMAESGILEAYPDDLRQPLKSAPLGQRPHTLREEDLSPENYLDMTLAEVVEHAKHGLLYPPDDTIALTAQLLRLSRDESRRARKRPY